MYGSHSEMAQNEYDLQPPDSQNTCQVPPPFCRIQVISSLTGDIIGMTSLSSIPTLHSLSFISDEGNPEVTTTFNCQPILSFVVLHSSKPMGCLSVFSGISSVSVGLIPSTAAQLVWNMRLLESSFTYTDHMINSSWMRSPSPFPPPLRGAG